MDKIQELMFPKEKEKQLYIAVIEMINEDVDVRALTVSEIAKKAGVGKGTTYEYFKTKEELVIKALLYDIIKQITIVKELVDKKETFHDRFMVLLDYMQVHRDDIKPFNYMFKMAAGSHESMGDIKEKYTCFDENLATKFIESLIDWFYEKAEKESLVGDKNKLLLKSALLSQIVEFTMILHNKCSDSIDIGEAKEYIYAGLLAKIK